MLAFIAAWPDRVWAIEGCEGIGRHIAHRLLADGQDIVDVPAKLSARARGCSPPGRAARQMPPMRTRSGWSAPGWPGWVRWSPTRSPSAAAAGGRRRSIGEEHTRKVSQLHRILLEMLPGGAKKYLSAAQAKVLLAGVRPGDPVGETRKGSPPSWSLTWNGSTPARRPPTQSSRPWSQGPGPRCWVCTASAPLAPPGYWSRSATCPASPTATTSRPGPAPPRSTPHPGTTCATASPAAGTDRSTGCCTSWPPSSCAPRPKGGPTSTDHTVQGLLTQKGARSGRIRARRYAACRSSGPR